MSDYPGIFIADDNGNYMDERNTHYQSRLQQLRIETEARLAGVLANEPAKSAVAALLHELHVQQLDLENQNEQLLQSRANLEGALERYVELYDFAPVGCMTLTIEGVITEINHTGAKLLDVERSKLISWRFARFIAEQDQENWHRLCLQAFEQGDTQVCKLSISRADGSSRYLHLDCKRINPAGVLPLLRIGFTDITACIKAEIALQEESEYRYRTLLQNARDSIVISDIKGNPEEINRAGEQLFGYTRDELCRLKLTQLYPANEVGKVKQHFEEVTKKTLVAPFETKILTKDGQLVDVEIRSSLIEIGGRCVMQGVFINLTERKVLEIQRLAQDKARHDALLRLVHHRINNDLQGITGMLHLFAHAHPETADALNQAISRVQSVSVIHGLQSISARSSVCLCELTVAIAKSVGMLWQQPIDVDIPEDWTPGVITQAEAVPLALVLNELISNAVKHNASDNPVSVILREDLANNIMQLVIYNRGLLPAGFNFDAAKGIGTGLKLVSAILPRSGVNLFWVQQEGTVVTNLDLNALVIHLEANK
ncbi:MAG: PAS domain S-box protein [Methylococcales bacterium]